MVVDSVELHQTRRADKEVDGSEGVVDGDDDEGVTDLGVSFHTPEH